MTQAIPARLRVAAGIAPPPDRTIPVHFTPQGTVCPLSRARVAAPITVCPLGCAGVKITVSDGMITLADIATAVADLCEAHEDDGANDDVRRSPVFPGHTYRVAGHTERTDRFIIDIDGGVQSFVVTITETR